MAAAAVDVAESLSSLSVQGRDASGTNQSPAQGGAPGEASQQGEAGPASIEKQLRAIRKKVCGQWLPFSASSVLAPLERESGALTLRFFLVGTGHQLPEVYAHMWLAICLQIRQAESLEAAVASRGGTMTVEEQDKISRLAAWREEEATLQEQLSKT